MKVRFLLVAQTLATCNIFKVYIYTVSNHQDVKQYGSKSFVWFDSLHPSQQIFSHVGMGLPQGRTNTKQRIKCLAQGHNTVNPPAVRLKPATLQSPVKCSTNSPKRLYHLPLTLIWVQPDCKGYPVGDKSRHYRRKANITNLFTEA